MYCVGKSGFTLNNNPPKHASLLHSCWATLRMAYGIREAAGPLGSSAYSYSPSPTKAPPFVFGEQERTFKLTCAARHRAQTLHHRKAKPGETVGYLRSQSQTSERPLLLRSWQTLELRKEGIVYGCWGEKNTRQQPAALLRGR